jgi:hypothetical protein
MTIMAIKMSHQPTQFIPRFDNPNQIINTAFIKHVECNESKCIAVIYRDKVTQRGPHSNPVVMDRGIICKNGTDCYDRMVSFYQSINPNDAQNGGLTEK